MYLHGRSKRGTLLLPQGYRCDRVGWGYSGSMKSRAWIILTVMIGLLVGVGYTSAVADSNLPAPGVEGESWQPAGLWSLGDQGFLLRDSRGPTSFDGTPMLSANIGAGRKLCKSYADTHCAGSDYMNFEAPLGVCSGDIQIDCIESFESIDESGTVTAGSFIEYAIPEHINMYLGDPGHGLPSPQTPGIWNLGGAKHAAGSQYALSVIIAGGGGTKGCKACILDVRSFRAMLGPVSTALSPDIRRDPSGLVGYNQHSESIVSNSLTVLRQTALISPTASAFQCAVIVDSTDYCFIQRPFPSSVRFRLKIRLHQEPSGWMHGRMVDPLISISKQAAGGILLQMEAAPTKVPVVYKQVSFKSLPQEIRDFYQECGVPDCIHPHPLSMPPDFNIPADPSARWIVSNPNPSAPTVFQELKLWLPLVGDSSAADQSKWIVQTLDEDQMLGTNSCFTKGDGIKGIVSTNASAYSAGPPAFGESSLKYKVAAPHFDHAGAVFKGTYSLNIRSDVARCLYSFSSAPIKASIEVINENGEQSVSTNSIQEKNGWLSLNASGFTFSSPTLKVKLEQVEVVTPMVPPVAPVVPVPATVTPGVVPARPSQAIAAKKSITCVKGKSVKKMAGANPKCPTGYKKAG